jgi:VanZ family protein
MKSKSLHVGHRWNPWFPPLLWAVVIFVLSSIPGSSYPRASFPGADKIAHFFLYATMGALCARALLLRRTAAATATPLRTRLLVLAGAVALATFYGVSDELHQLLVPGRSADWRDALADAVGALAGGVVALRVWSQERHDGDRDGPFV